MAANKQIKRIIEGAIKGIEVNSQIKYSRTPSFRAYCRNLLPYGIVCDNGKFLVLNRGYKPLGVGEYGDSVEYGDYICEISEDAFNKIAPVLTANSELGKPFFYHDVYAPWLSQADLRKYENLLRQFLAVL